VRSVEGGWPFYVEPATTPAGVWERLSDPGVAVVDEAVLTQLQVRPGDTLTVGRVRVRIAGTVRDLPTDLGFQTAVGPRLWLGPGTLGEAGLLGFGSLARYETYLRLPERADQDALRERYQGVFRATQVDYTTAERRARSITRGVEDLGRFLGLVGLGALLLGGVGVASAIHVFVQERLTQVAVLRCLGARQNGLFAAYLLQAGALGFGGAALGAGVGVAVQHLLPAALAGILPVDVDPRVSWPTVAAGVGIGVWVATIFALLPLLGVRNVPPLRALRSDLEGGTGAGRRARALAVLALAASVVLLAVLEAPEPRAGLAFAAGLAVVSALLWAAGRLFIAGSRRLFPRRAPYPVRQGFSNLFRPRNQTVGITLALGFGAFVVGTVLQVRSNLASNLRFDADEGRPNLLLFDIQGDQREGVVDLFSPAARAAAEVTPLVPARLAAINGVRSPALRELEGPERPEGWALRREYRHTWRGELTDAEALVEGAWWDELPEDPDGPARISVEQDLARDLAVGLGDTLTWSVAGREIPSVVTSLRRVDWERFRTNFFVVFEPGGLDDAPATWVVLTRVDGAEARADFQRRLVAAFPNVSALDVSRIQEVIEGILGQVERAIGFLAGFAAVAGLIVLAGSLASSRHQRLREGALLKTLGARRGQLLVVLFAEFLSLGTLATLSGLLLSVGASWLLIALDFGMDYRVDAVSLLAIWFGITLLTVVTGLAGSRGLLRRPPLPVLRELAG
jgi:putative ABC transport system permease protein